MYNTKINNVLSYKFLSTCTLQFTRHEQHLKFSWHSELMM